MSGKQKVKILVSILLTALMVLYIFPTAALAAGNTDKAPEDLFGLRTGGAANPNKPVRRAQAVYTNRAPVFGADDQVWELAKPYTVDQVIYDYDAGTPSKGVFRVLWDDNNLYIRVEVTDDGVFGGTSVLRQSDSVEVMVSERNYRGHLVPDNDTDPTRVHDKRKANWYRLSAPAGSGSGEFGRAQARYSNSPWSSSAVNLEADSGWARSIRTDTGFVTEFKIPHYDGSVASKDGVIYGFDILINDAESSNASINERRIITWNNTANDSDGLRVSTVNWGELELTNWAAANSDTAKFVIQENGHRGWKTTTALNIYFSKDVEDLSAEDITLSGLEVTKGALTKVDNRHYILEIGGVTQPERNVAADDPSRYVTVAIDKEGVTTEPASGLVFYEMNAPPAGYEYFVSVHDPNFEERMPVSYGLNDPFQFFVTTDGKSGGFGEVIPNRVVTEKDWEDRRKEIQALAQYYWYGTTGTFAQGKDIIEIITDVTVSGNTVAVTLEDNGRSTSISFTVNMPSEESIEAAGYDPSSIPWGIGSDQTAYGIASVSLPWFGGGNLTDLYPSDYRVTGHDAGSIMQYAWRVGVFPAALEWLEKNDPENATGLNPYGGFVTGVSIGGKQARMAAAMNDRIAVSAASESGAFGINALRYLQEGRLYNYAGVRQTNHFRYQKTYNSLYYSGEWGWLGLNTARKFGEHNKHLIPFDMHLISALMAPTSKNPNRGFIEFLNDSQNQGWAAAEPGVMSYMATKEVFDWLGSDNIAIRVRDGGHALQNRDLPYIVAVMDALFGPEKENIELRRPFSSSGGQRDNSLPSEYYKTINDLTAYPHNPQSSYIQWSRPGKDRLWVDVQHVTEGIPVTFNAYTDEDVEAVSVKIYDHGDLNPTAPPALLYDLGTFPAVNGKAVISLSGEETRAGRYVVTTVGETGREKRSVSFDGLDIATALRHSYNTEQSHTTNAYGFTSKVNQKAVRMFYNDLELPPSTLEQETSREPSAFVMEYGVSHPFGSGSQRVRIENLQLEAMPGYTFVLYAENPDNRPSWSASEAVQRNSSYANWPPFHNGVGNGSGATDENREDGSVPIIWPPAATNFSADVEFDWSRILTESKLDIYFSEEMDPNNFGIGFDFSDDFSIEWADDNKSVTITFENITKSIEGSAYIMRLKDAQGNMIPGPIGSSTDTLPYIPPYELIITTDRNMVNKGEYFNVDASFSEPASTNALSITFSYNPELFRYRGFTPAEGVSLVNTIRDDESGTITFVLARLEGYAWEGIGRVLFSALDDAELPMGRTSIDAGMKYAYKAETGDKYLLSLGASAGLITGRPWTGDPTLIDLSNAIDYFGTSSEDSIWERAMFYDFNSNGEIDISDITYIAVRIRL